MYKYNKYTHTNKYALGLVHELINSILLILSSNPFTILP